MLMYPYVCYESEQFIHWKGVGGWRGGEGDSKKIQPNFFYTDLGIDKTFCLGGCCSLNFVPTCVNRTPCLAPSISGRSGKARRSISTSNHWKRMHKERSLNLFGNLDLLGSAAFCIHTLPPPSEGEGGCDIYI